MYLTQCYMLEEDDLIMSSLRYIYTLGRTFKSKGPKVQRAKGPVCRTTLVDSRDGPFDVRTTTNLVIAYYEVQT